MKPSGYFISFFLLLLVWPVHAVMLSGESLNITQPVDDDLYAAGGSINILTAIRGDLVTAGGRLNIEADVSGDVMAAGGEVQLRARVSDDVRIAGGEVLVQGMIRDDLIAVAGSLRITNNTRVGGESRLAGGEVIVDGRHEGPVNIRAGRVLLLGQIDKDVEIWAEAIELGASARIGGDLITRGPNPPRMQPGAAVAGVSSHQDMDIPAGPVIAGLFMALLFSYLTLVLTAVVLYLLFPTTADNVAATVKTRFWGSLGLGLALFAATPLVIVLSLSTAIGALLGLILLLLYLLLLLTGYLGGAYGFSLWLRTRFGQAHAGRFGAALWLALALLILGLVGLVPVVGVLVGLIVLLLGMGALSLLLRQAYSGQRALSKSGDEDN